MSVEHYEPPGGSHSRHNSSQSSYYNRQDSSSTNHSVFYQHNHHTEESRDQEKFHNGNIARRRFSSRDSQPNRQVEKTRREQTYCRTKSSSCGGPELTRQEYFVGNLTKSLFILHVSNMIDKSASHYSRATSLPTHSNPESVFFSVTKPDIPTKDYLTRLVRYTQCNNSAFVVMLIYLDRIGLANKRLLVTHFNMHRLLVTALTLACKMLDDRCFSNVHYAKVGGIPTVREMNRLELQFLKYLRYRLHVRKEEYDCKVAFLESRAENDMIPEVMPNMSPVTVSEYPYSSPVTPTSVTQYTGTFGRLPNETFVRLPNETFAQFQFRDTSYSHPFHSRNSAPFVSTESTISRDTTGISGRRSTLSTGSSSDQHYPSFTTGPLQMTSDFSHRISSNTPMQMQNSHSNDWGRHSRYNKRQGRPQGRGLG